MVCGISKCTHTRSKKSLAVAFVVMLFLQATRIIILEKRSTTTKTQSFPHLVDEARHVVHGYGFPWPVRNRKRGVHASFLSGRFGNNTSSVGDDILADLLSKFHPVEMFLQHFHYLFDVEVSFHLTVVGFLYQTSLTHLMERRWWRSPGFSHRVWAIQRSHGLKNLALW
jgi:hypothetical protein